MKNQQMTFWFIGLILFSVPLIYKKEMKNEKFYLIYFLIGIVVIAILAFVLISMTFLWTPMTVNGPSMNNTLHDGEHIILLTAWYSYTYGDIKEYRAQPFL